MINVISAVFRGAQSTTTRNAYQYDYGQVLKTNLALPETYEVQFSNNSSGGGAITQIGNADGVTIPDQMFISGAPIYAWIFLHQGADDGETVYFITIPVTKRAKPTSKQPTPVQKDAITQAIAALNAAVEQTGQDVESASASATAAQAAVDSVLNMTVSADTLPSGSDASVTKSVVDDAVHLAFGIPQGAQGVQGEQGVQGPTGATPNFTIGTVQTLLPTQDATATITGTAEAPVLNLGIPKGYSGDATNLAADYSSSKTYSVGEYCIYNGTLYRCTTPITTAESWTAAHWTAVTLGDDVSDLKSALNIDENRLTILDGQINTEWEIGQRYINNGQEAWVVNSARMTTKRGTYLNLKAGTVVALKNLQEYQFLIGYSADGGTTWQGGSNREEPFTLANDCIAFITIWKKSGSFTEEEMNNVATNGIVILIPDSDVTGVNTQIIDGISIGNANFGAFELKASEHGIATQWISAGLTNYLSATKYGDYIPASKGDVFLISAEESVSYPSLFTSIGLAVYELNSGGATVRSTDLTDISAPVKYTVQNENTVKICIYGNLKAESTSVTAGYREIFEYKLNIVKQLSSSGIDEVLTEAGDTWEV